MRVATVALVYNEAHFIERYLKSIPDWVETKLVLVSEKPWYGEELPDDGSAKIAEELGATVVKKAWPNEEIQRNTGQAMLSEYDWVLNIEPDEFLSNEDWEKLREFLEVAEGQAYVVNQRVFWGKGMESDPPEDFKPIIITKPTVRFPEKRNVDTHWEIFPDITLLHFAWLRTDSQIWKKVSHYSHAVDFDTRAWFRDVWLARRTKNVHPTTASSIPKLIPAVLPPEIEELDLYPPGLNDLTKEQMKSIFGDSWEEIEYDYSA